MRVDMQWENEKVLVIGSGASGISSAALLVNEKANVILYDGNAQLQEENIRTKKQELQEVQIVLGDFSNCVLSDITLVIVSPGVPLDIPILCEIQKQGIPIWGEIELAYVCGVGRVLGITGTNGKTTTTALLGEIMKAHYKDTYVVGNIGNPYTDIARETTEESVVVAELSSFQLETIHTFYPKVSAILNLAPDHLDRHHTMEAYIEAKMNIAKNQTEKDVCVLNDDDELVRGLETKINAKIWHFSSSHEVACGMYLQNDKLLYINKDVEILCDVKELKLLGVHNYENVMAASLMALALGVPIETVRTIVREFEGVPHRIEYVGEYDGVAYYNDSKGTNPDAAIRAIQAMERPTFLIAGGYDKQADYKEWIQAFDGKVKKLVLLGATRENIAMQAREVGFEEIVFVDTLKEALAFCKKQANTGEAVLLSPACASWGMFRNYEERGDAFKQIVRERWSQEDE